MASNKYYWIIVKKCYGKRRIHNNSGRSKDRNDYQKEIPCGMIFEDNSDIYSTCKKVMLVSIDADDIFIQYDTRNLSVISAEQTNLLVAINDFAERIDFFNNSQKMEHALTIDENSEVNVIFSQPNHYFPATIRSKHTYPIQGSGSKRGTWFGVQLQHDHQLNQDQPPIEVAVNSLELRYPRVEPSPSNRMKTLSKGNESPTQSISSASNSSNSRCNSSTSKRRSSSPVTELTPLPPLAMDERIVWMSDNGPEFGIVKWIGHLDDAPTDDWTVGVEFDNPVGEGTGKHNDEHLFHAQKDHASLIPIMGLMKADEFLATFGSDSQNRSSASAAAISHEHDNDSLCGKHRGIQGHHNSCYLDATLFSMFAFSDVFDTLLYRPRRSQDIPEYDSVQAVLKDEIVKQLRRCMYVRADKVMKLRKMLDAHSNVTGLTSEEKDPEEFLNSLLQQILKANPFLKLSSGQDAFYYQLFMEKDENITLPTTQQLFERSFLSSNLKLNDIPSCLIIQMPRFGKDYKMYKRIVPSQFLDITDVLANSPRQCSICGLLAKFECKECFDQITEGLEGIGFCEKCVESSHSHHIERKHHKPETLDLPESVRNHFSKKSNPPPISRVTMELFAVVCIATSHYVTFAKTQPGQKSSWVFFDSMADRVGEQHGYNIPEVKACPKLPYWLSAVGYQALLGNDEDIDEDTRRMLSDCYMCMYESHDMEMYK